MTADPRGPCDFGERYARSYGRGRRMLPATATLWLDAARRHVGGRAVRRIADVGCGTGRFAPLLAETFRAAVVGVDPSEAMLLTALAENGHARVAYVRGTSSALPLRDGMVDLAWLSMVVHLFPDLAAAAREVARVLAPGGAALVRAPIRERLGSVRMYRYFPSALRADAVRVPSLDEVVRGFAAGGLRLGAHDVLVQTTDASLAEHAARLRLRAMSSFQFVPDDEFEAGIRAMEEDAAGAPEPRPVTEEIDLVTFVHG